MTRARGPRAQRSGATKRRPVDPNFCCLEWERFSKETKRSWGWQVIHAFGHSRTTFSVATVATKAAIDTEQARAIVADATAWGWVAPLVDDPMIYVGCLKSYTRPEAS